MRTPSLPHTAMRLPFGENAAQIASPSMVVVHNVRASARFHNATLSFELAGSSSDRALWSVEKISLPSAETATVAASGRPGSVCIDLPVVRFQTLIDGCLGFFGLSPSGAGFSPVPDTAKLPSDEK